MSLIGVSIFVIMYKLKLNQIREVLGMEVKMETITTIEGVTYSVEKIEVGYPVMAEDVPVTEGEYTLEDGTILKCDGNGVITEIVIPIEEVVEAEATPTAPTNEDTFALIFGAISELANEVLELKTKMEKFAKAPAATPIKKTEVENISTFSKIEKLNYIKNQLKK